MPGRRRYEAKYRPEGTGTKIECSLSAFDIDNLNLAKWWGTTPDVTSSWSLPEWLNAEEFMMIRRDIEDPPPKEVWKGPEK